MSINVGLTRSTRSIYYRFVSTQDGYSVYADLYDGYYVDTFVAFNQLSFGYCLDMPITATGLDTLYPIVKQFMTKECKTKCYVHLSDSIREKIEAVMILRLYNLFGSSRVSGSYIAIRPICKVNKRMQVEISYLHSGTALAESLTGVFKINLKKLGDNEEIAVRALPYGR